MASLSLPATPERADAKPAFTATPRPAGGLLVAGFADPAAADYVDYARGGNQADITLTADQAVCRLAGPGVRAIASEAFTAGWLRSLDEDITSVVIFLQPRVTAGEQKALDGIIALAAQGRASFVCVVATGEAHNAAGGSELVRSVLRRLRYRVPRIVVFRPGQILSPRSRALANLRHLGALYPLVPRRVRGCCVEGNELFAAIERERKAAPRSDCGTQLLGAMTSAGAMSTVGMRTRLPVETVPDPRNHGQASMHAHGNSSANSGDQLVPKPPVSEPDSRARRSRRPRTYALLGPNRPWRDWLAQYRERGPLRRCVTVVCTMLALLGVGQLAAVVFAAISRRHPALLRWNIGTLRPGSFRELLALYNKYNFRHVKVVGYNNGINHFGHRYPGKTIVSTVRLNRVVRAGPEAIRADCGATIRVARDFLTRAGQDLYVIPNYSYVCLGTAFFVPIHGSAAAFSCVADTITNAVLYDPVLDRLIATSRQAPDFRDRAYDLDADVLLLRLTLCVKPKASYYVHQQQIESPDADLLLAGLRDTRAANVEVRKPNAAGTKVQLIKFYNQATDADTPVLELPRDSLGRLWDRLEENRVTSFLMHALTRHLAFHVELFFTAQEFATFWKDHGGLPLRKIQLRYIKRDGLPRSPFRDHDCVSADMFMFRRNRGAFEAYLKRTFPVVRANPGKHSV
jgi:hypothetical protein